MADNDDPGAEPPHGCRDVLDVRRERQLRGVGGLAPEVVSKVDRVAFPAAPGEVAEEALPEPRPAQLAVDEEQRLAPRTTLRQPRLDVDAAIGQLDLVLAHRPALGRRDRRSREQYLGQAVDQVGHRVTTRAG
jgi:hypothetical protein